MSERCWLVTGASTGLGRCLVEELATRGERVVATVRRQEDADALERIGDGVTATLLDVTQPEAEVSDVVDRAVAAMGGLDVVVNNAGYGLVGALEETTDDVARHQMETNFFGSAKVIKAALPHLRHRGAGLIVNVSSVAGFSGVPGMSYYNASKFALEGMSEALQLELAPLGIKVTIVEPGAFRTKWAGASLVTTAVTMPEYEPSTARLRNLIPKIDGRQPGDPAKAAAIIADLADHPEPPLRLVLGADGLDVVRRKLAAVQTEVDTWQDVSTSTAFAE